MILGLLLIYSLTVFVSASSSEDCPRKCNCSQSQIINCIGEGLKAMPRRISSHIERFLADNNKITELPGRMLINGVSLQRLTISRNSVANLKIDNFLNTPALIYLDLSYNNITLVPQNAFFGLTSLRILKLDSNQISHISPSAFEHLRSLRELDLSENRIELLAEGLFTSLGQLQSLRLNGNQISTIPRGIFRSLPELEILDLSRNRIRSISTGAFSGLESLQKLFLHDNQIENLDTHLPMPNTSCDTKAVGTTSLAEIVRPPSGQRGAFENLRQLRMLDLRNNELQFIPPASFFGLRQLRTLYLGGNLWRCNCPLKWSLEALQRVGHRHDFIQGAIICNTPMTLKDSNLLQLGFENIERRSNNSRLNQKETDSNGYNQRKIGHRKSATTAGSLRDGATFAPHGDHSTSIRYESRPSNDLVTQYNNVRPSTVSSNIKATSRSLISTPQIGLIARTTSFVFNPRGSKRGSGVNQRSTPTIRNHKTDDQQTNGKNNAQKHTGVTHSYQPDVEIGESDGGRGVFTKKEKKRTETWLLPTAIALLILAVFACTSVIVQFMTRRNKSNGCCPKVSKSHKNTSIRYVTSNPLLYDSHHFVSRPLPQAPRPLQQNAVADDEVRWTNGGVYGLGSNRSSFVSLQNHTVTESLANTGQNNEPQRAVNDTQRPRFAEPMPNRNTNVYSYVETTVPRRMLDQRPPLMPPTHPSLHPDDLKFRKTMEIRKRMEERRKRRRVLMEMSKSPENNIGPVSTACGNTENKIPPPPPRRNDSSKIRCQELLERNRIRNPVTHFPEYCEIDRRIPKRIVRAEYREKQFCKTNIEKILIPHIDREQSGEERVNSRSVMEVHRSFLPAKSCNQENHWCNADINPGNAIHDIPEPFLNSQHGTRSAKPRDHCNKIQSSKYDRLFFRDQAPNMIGMIREDSSPESNRRNLLLDDMNAPDSCFKSAEDDFVISFPRVTTRKSCPGGLFGSDQHILDSLRQQDLGMYKPRHHTAPTGLQDLTLPLSEISTDEDEQRDVFRKDSQRLPSYSSAGSLSTVHAKTLDSNDDVFVYTMAGEAPTEIIPKIVINDGLEEEYETVGDDYVNHEKSNNNFVSDDDTSHQYHHLQFMYSGFSGDNKSSRQKENTTSLRDDHKEESSSHRNWKNFQKNLKKRRRERHYYYIDPSEPQEEYDNVSENSEKNTPGSKKPKEKLRKLENEKMSRMSTPKEVMYASRESEIYSKAFRGNNKEDVDMKERANGEETIFKSEQDRAKIIESDSEVNTGGNKENTSESVEEILRQCCSINDERLSRKKHRQRPEAYCFIKLDENKNPIVKIRLVKNSTGEATETAN